MKTIPLTLLFVIAFSCLLSGQNPFSSITGGIVEQDHNPAAFATIQLKNVSDSSLVKASYADENGKFEIPGLSAGEYFLEISYVGFLNHKSNHIQLREQKDMEVPEIMLISISEELETVVVTARKPVIELKPDRTVFNVDGSINASGSSAFELLRKSPGVVFDNNDNVILQGKTGIQIHINGKPSPLGGQDLVNFLKNLQSSEIEAIEIITNPSAGFDAEGTAGVINIRLKKSKSLGFNGALNLGYSIADNSRFRNSVQLNYRNRAINVFGNYSQFNGKNNQFQNFYRIQNGLEFDQETKQTSFNDNHNFRGGADFFIDKKNTIGVLLSGNLNRSEFESQGTSFIGDFGEVPSQILDASSDIDGQRRNYQVNLNYQFNDSKGQTLIIDFDGGFFKNRVNSFQPNTYREFESGTPTEESIFTSETPTDIHLLSGKFDYTRPLLGGVLQGGVKASMVKTDNTLDFYELQNGLPVKDLERSNQFTYDERVYAGYINFMKKVDDQIDFNLGLRIEQTHSIGDLASIQDLPEDYVERKYLNIFPSGGLSYKLNKDHSLRLNFSRRIDRPNYEDLNPFEFRLDELTYQKGNAFLQPQYANSIEITHIFRNRVSTTLGYTLIEDFFARITDTVETRRSFITKRNLTRQEVLNLNISSPFSVTEWWNGYANLNIYHTQNEADFGDGRTVDLSVTGFSVYNQHNFTLLKGFNLELSGFYNSPGLWEGVMEVKTSRSYWTRLPRLVEKYLSTSK